MSILGMSISKKLACSLIVLPEVPKSGRGGGLKAYPCIGGGNGGGGASTEKENTNKNNIKLSHLCYIKSIEQYKLPRHFIN